MSLLAATCVVLQQGALGPVFRVQNVGARPVKLVAGKLVLALPSGMPKAAVQRLFPQIRPEAKLVVRLRSGKAELGRITLGGRMLLSAASTGVDLTIQDREVLVRLGSRRQRILLTR